MKPPKRTRRTREEIERDEEREAIAEEIQFEAEQVHRNERNAMIALERARHDWENLVERCEKEGLPTSLAGDEVADPHRR